MDRYSVVALRDQATSPPAQIAFWDNGAVQHLAIFDHGATLRKLNRIGTLGGVPEHWTAS